MNPDPVTRRRQLDALERSGWVVREVSDGYVAERDRRGVFGETVAALFKRVGSTPSPESHPKKETPNV